MSSVNIDVSEVMRNLYELDDRVKVALDIIGDTTGQKMLGHAQNNRPWVDRTNSAKDQLHYSVDWEGQVLDISIAHGVDYGVWLETNESFQGRYQILDKARDSQVENFKSAIRAMNL